MWYRGDGEGGVEPCSVEESYEFMESSENKIIKQEHIGKYFISTVFLGLDHGLTTSGPPLLFETMVFNNTDDTIAEVAVQRYSTQPEAVEGHEYVVSIVMKKIKEDEDGNDS